MYLFPVVEYNDKTMIVLNFYETAKEVVESRLDLGECIITSKFRDISEIDGLIRQILRETGKPLAKGPIHSEGLPDKLDEEKKMEYYTCSDQKVVTIVPYGRCLVFLNKGNFVLESKNQKKIIESELEPFLEKVYEYKDKMKLKWTV